MGFAWRALVVVAVFVGVGYGVDRTVLRHERAANAPEAQVRLAGAMAGLFCGGASASVVVLVLAFGKKTRV